LINESVRVRGEPPQDVLEVCERRHVDQFAALNQRVQQRRAARPFKAPGEKPVLAPDRDEAELVFGAGMPPARLCRVM
jgi:hypothetical protein